MAAGVVAQGLIGNRLIVLDNAAETASRILGRTSLYQLGFTLYMLEMTISAPCGREIESCARLI